MYYISWNCHFHAVRIKLCDDNMILAGLINNHSGSGKWILLVSKPFKLISNQKNPKNR
jgi:hypothetical protein